jgi:hypothetical protein
VTRVAVVLMVVPLVTPSVACVRSGPQTVPAGTVDTLDYVIGQASLWPRTGTQFQHQIVDRAGREICWVKYGGRSYSFTDGRWLPRRLSGVWTLDLPDNRVIDFTRECRATERRFPYRLRAHLEPPRDLGGDIGIRATLILEYQPYAPGARPDAAAIERFHFAQGAGWYLWESPRGTARFDRVGGPAPARTRRCGGP